MNTLALEPIFGSWLLILLLAVLLIGVPLLVAIHGNQLNTSRRRILVGLRLATAALLLLAALRPALLRTDSLPTRATLAILLDQSRSMTLPAEDGRSRWEVQQQAAAALRQAAAQWDDSLALEVLSYSAQVTPWSEDQGDNQADGGGPDGNATDLAAALGGALQSAAGQPLAGVVLLGDGVHNPPRQHATAPAGEAGALATAPPTAAPRGDPQTAARTLASLDVPLWTVGIGPPGDADQVHDVQVDELAQSLNVFAGNEFDLRFVVRSRALQGVEMPLRIRLSSERDPTNAVELASRRYTPSRTTDATSMTIPLIAPEPGTYRLEVAVDPQEGETLLANNSQFAFVEVREGGGRILYLEGQPRPEQTFIRRSLRRFPDLELTYRWIADDGTTDWPVDLSNDLRPGSYDVYVLGDLPAAALGEQQLAALATAVQSGSGLLTLGGLRALAAGGYNQSPLAAVLPFTMDAAAGGAEQLPGPISPQVTTPHAITTLDPNNPTSLTSQQAAWNALPPLVGANRLGPPRVAPGVNVLLQSPEEHPLLVVGEYGQGRVATFAGDSTWRWWRQGHDAEHRRFWRQMILWLLHRDDDTDLELAIELPERRFESGEPAPWQVTHSGPRPGTDLQLAIVDAQGQSIALAPASSEVERGGGNGDAASGTATLRGTLPTLPTGLYQLRAAVAGSDLTAEKSFQVLQNDRELATPYADLTYLAQLSGQTAASGGEMFLPTQVEELIERITELRRTSSAPVVKKYRLGDTPLSAWPLFLAVVALLSAEWVLRRRWGLV